MRRKWTSFAIAVLMIVVAAQHATAAVIEIVGPPAGAYSTGEFLEYRVYVRDLEKPVVAAQLLIGFEHELASGVWVQAPSSVPPWNDLVYNNWFEHDAGVFGGLDVVVGVDRQGNTSTQEDGCILIIYFLVTADTNSDIFQPWFRPRPGDPAEPMYTMLAGADMTEIIPTELKLPEPVFIDPMGCPPYDVDLALDPSDWTNADEIEACVWAKDDESGVAGYKYTIRENGEVVPYTTLLVVDPPQYVHSDCMMLDVSTLGDGTYNMQVGAYDAAGNYAYSDWESFRIDRTPPVFAVDPTADPATCTNADSVTIAWQASDAASGIAKEEIFVDGNPVPDNPVTSPYSLDASGLADGTHIVAVVATDAAGNSSTKTVPVTIDRTNPYFVADPAADPAGCTAEDTVAITWLGADDGCGLATAEIMVDGVPVPDNPVTSPYNLDVELMADGTHAMTVVLTDVAGNTAQESVDITLDKTDPYFAEGPAADPSTCTNADTITITWTGVDAGCGLQRADLYVDGNPVADNPVTSPYSLDVSGLDDGVHTVLVTLTDVAGNTEDGSVGITLDNVAPQFAASPAADPADCTNEDSISITWEASDVGCGVGTAEVFVDGNPVADNPATSPYSLDVSGLSDGGHTVTVVVADVAGNTVSEPVDITLDKTSPVFTSGPTVDPAGCTNATLIEVTFCVEDAGCGIDTVEAFVDGNPITLPPPTGSCFQIQSALNDGMQTVTIVATDVAGNTAEESVQVLVDRTDPYFTASPAADPAGCTNDDVVTITWEGADDGCGLQKADMYVDGNPVADNPVTSPYALDVSGLADGVHTVKIVLTDVPGNTSEDTVDITLDKTAPYFATSPAADPAGCTNADTITITWEGADDGCGLDKAEMYVDGNPVPDNPVTGPYDLDVSGLVDGGHTVVVVLADVAGNTAQQGVGITLDKTAPYFTTSPAADPADCTNADTIAISWEAADDGCGVEKAEIIIDGNPVPDNPVTSPYGLDVSGLPDGVHTVTLIVTDKGGNTAQKSFTITIDKTGPVFVQAPAADPAGCTDADTFEITWEATDAGCGLDHVDIFVDGNPVPDNPVTSPYTLDAGALLDGVHTVVVVATDAPGNTAQDSVSITIDRTDPYFVAGVAADPATCTNADTIGITWQAADDGCGIAKAEMFVDGNPVADNPVTSPYDLDVSGLADGSHTVSVIITDEADHTAQDSTGITLDKTNPYFTADPAANPATCTNVDTVVITWDAGDDGCGVEKADIFVNGNPVPDNPVSSPYDLDVSGLGNGVNAVTVIVTDKGGNTVEKSVNVIRDTTEPYFTVLPAADPATCTNADTVEITWEGADADCGLASAEIMLDGSPVADNPVTSPYDLSVSGIADGNHTVTVVLTDVAGNTLGKSVGITLDKTAPYFAGDPVAEPATCTNSDTVVISWEGADDGCGLGTAELFVDSTPVADNPATSPYDLDVSGLSDGVHVVTVILTDVAGNTAQDSVNITLDKTDPALSVLSVTQPQDSPLDLTPVTANLLDPLNCAVRGAVTVVVTASDAGCGLAGDPVLEAWDACSQELTVSSPVEDPAGTFTFTVSIDSGTCNGDATFSVTASDVAGNDAEVSGQFCVNTREISGQITLQQLAPPSAGVSRIVTFAVTDDAGNVLKKWHKLLFFTQWTQTTDYTVENVPAGTANLSAKTGCYLSDPSDPQYNPGWHIRRKLPVNWAGVDGTVNFTGDRQLLGGDLNNDNKIDVIDYSILKADWFTQNSRSDVDGSGWVNIADYAIMRPNFFKFGDPE